MKDNEKKLERPALALFPCDPFLAEHFCSYLQTNFDVQNCGALVLDKQKAALATIRGQGFKRIWTIDEPFYGSVTQDLTRQTFHSVIAEGYDLVLFPQSSFKGNGFLLGSCLAPTVRAIQVTQDQPVSPPIEGHGRGGLCGISPNYEKPSWDREAYLAVLDRFEELKDQLNSLGESSFGERPTTGLITGDPLVLEEYVRILTAAKFCEGKEVIDFGSGLGFGAFTLAKSARKVVGIEVDEGAVAFSQKAWQPLAENLTFQRVDPHTFRLEPESAEVVVCIEVLEHVENPVEKLGEFYRTLRPGGMLIASTPEPALAPYRVNENPRSGEPANELQRQGIWKWHISGLSATEAKLHATEAGFSEVRIVYPTYLTGFEKRQAIVDAVDADTALTILNETVPWDLDDFTLTDEYSPCFSGYSYVFMARKF